MKSERRSSARLLSGKDELSILEKEEVLRAVLHRTQAEQPVRRRMMRPLVWVPAAALLVAGAITTGIWLGKDRGGFQARGGSGNGFGLEIACAGRSAGTACQPGDKLLFRVRTPADRGGFFSAVAEREDGTLLWYFPSDRLHSVSLGAADDDGLLAVGVVLGPEHLPGKVKVIGLVSEAPLDKEAVREVLAGKAVDGVAVVERSFEIGGRD